MTTANLILKPFALDAHRKPHLSLVNKQNDVRLTVQLARRTEMHHFRGKLFQGDKLCLDPANVYIDYDSTSKWSGYLLIKSEHDVAPGGTYTLKLEDGRAGQLRIDALTPDDSDKVRAMFVGEGSLG
jgi:hypothetical protein